MEFIPPFFFFLKKSLNLPAVQPVTAPSLVVKVLNHHSHQSKQPRNPLSTPRLRALSQSLETIKRAVEDIRITTIGIRVRILPNSLITPPSRNRTDRARPPRQHQRVGRGKALGVASALAPPRVVGVNHGVATRLAVVAVGKGLDPRHHGRGRQAVAGRLAGDGLEVDHAGQGDAVLGPAAAVREEVVRLSSAGGGVRVRKVVAAADQAGRGGAGVVRGELGVNVIGSFGGLLRGGGGKLAWTDG